MLLGSSLALESMTLVLKSLHWLLSEARIHYKILCLTYKALNDLAPDYLSGAITRYQPTHSLHSSEKDLLVVPKVQTKTYGSHAFAHNGPKLFNTLPEEIRLAPTYNTFEAGLKPISSALLMILSLLLMCILSYVPNALFIAMLFCFFSVPGSQALIYVKHP